MTAPEAGGRWMRPWLGPGSRRAGWWGFCSALQRPGRASANAPLCGGGLAQPASGSPERLFALVLVVNNEITTPRVSPVSSGQQPSSSESCSSYKAAGPARPRFSAVEGVELASGRVLQLEQAGHGLQSMASRAVQAAPIQAAPADIKLP